MSIKIKAYNGQEHLMSDDVYVQLIDHHYPKGTLLRLINGVDDNEEIGFHFSKGFVTVNNIMSTHAGWIGIKKEFIQKVGKLKHIPDFIKD